MKTFFSSALSKVLCVVILLVSFSFQYISFAQSDDASRIEVKIVVDEAEAVLSALAKKKAGGEISISDWQRIFSSEGYTRLKKREESMQRTFEDEDFKKFVLSEALSERAKSLEETLALWKQADITAASRRALAYLPAGARIRATIYPVIKPRENSFVFDVKNNPAIFLYLDPQVTKEQFENTLAHEMHHIGYGTACPSKEKAEEIARLPQNLKIVVQYLAAFGEGFAMLAAAGGTNAHPHAASKPEDRARWDRDVANFNSDLQKVEKFFTDVIEGKLNEKEIQETGFSFFGVQGPWYTVGWKMVTIIENTYGRARLIECMCDHRLLLETYNRAATEYNRTAREPVALWSAKLVEAISKTTERPANR
jgi:hypothetical protein